jgi:hypothetical protein
VHASTPVSEFDSIVHLPSPNPGAPPIDAPCRVLSCRGNRLALLTNHAIPVCIPLSVEHDDALYLGEAIGEVVQSNVGGTLYEVDVLIKQVLSGLQSLVALRARLLDEFRPDKRVNAEPTSSEGGALSPVRKRRA